MSYTCVAAAAPLRGSNLPRCTGPRACPFYTVRIRPFRPRSTVFRASLDARRHERALFIPGSAAACLTGSHCTSKHQPYVACRAALQLPPLQWCGSVILWRPNLLPVPCRASRAWRSPTSLRRHSHISRLTPFLDRLRKLPLGRRLVHSTSRNSTERARSSRRTNVGSSSKAARASSSSIMSTLSAQLSLPAMPE